MTGEGQGPPDRTRRETAAPDETRLEGPGTPDGTRREPPSPSDATVPESPAGADATRAEDAPAGRGAAGPSSAARFPEELAARFRPVRELDHGGQADVWLVEDDAGAPLVAKVYRPGFEGRQDILEILHDLEANEDIVPVVDYGRAGGQLYVVLEYVPGGNLKSLMTPGAPAPTDLVREVLAQLVAGLERLHGAGIEHQDLKPGNVLVRSRQPLDLVLADFGVATRTAETVRATRLGGMSWHYAPPEAFALRHEEEGLMLWRHKYDAWSLGVIVVEMLTGRHPLPQREAAIPTFFVTRSTDDLVEGVDDPAWRKLCRGLLRRDPEARWGTAEARRWLEWPDAPDLVVQDEALPATAPVPSRGFRFLGRDYATPADLGAAMASDWDMAGDLWRNQHPSLVQWLRHELGSTDLAARLEETDRAADLDLDAQLFQAIRALAPESPPSFRGQPLTAENLARIASRAAARPDGDDARLLVAVSLLPDLENAGNPALGPQAVRWSGAAAAYEGLCARHEELPEPTETDRLVLLAAATEGSGVTEQLRERTSEVLARQRRARQSPWFRRLGEVERAEAPVLYAMALLAAPAHAQITAQIRPRRKTQLLAVAAGVLAGVVFCFNVLITYAAGLELEADDFEPGQFEAIGEALGSRQWQEVPWWEILGKLDWKDEDWEVVWGRAMEPHLEIAGLGSVLGVLVGVPLVFWLWWRYGRNRLPGCLALVCGVLAVMAASSLTGLLWGILTFLVLGSSMILGYSIPGPMLVDMGFILSACVALGFGFGAALRRLNLMLTAGTGILATLAIMLVVALVATVVAAVSLPDWNWLFG